jgi:hypothetical protein
MLVLHELAHVIKKIGGIVQFISLNQNFNFAQIFLHINTTYLN